MEGTHSSYCPYPRSLSWGLWEGAQRQREAETQVGAEEAVSQTRGEQKSR